ncbi:hypothetical protein [Pantoea agglomerans]|uniref:hypothetical protein n=1 Tax=Enterobacter agglomerans TaxID=549 RepID=UPI002413341A|nr:hypothetical protein [Pantoea agglomerans]
MKWILIFWLINGHPSVATVEFDDQTACKAAFQAIKAVNDGEIFLRGVCVHQSENSK